jgi:Triosephosphate isomerase
MSFFETFPPLVEESEHCEIVICPSFLDLATAVAATRGTSIQIGAQTLHWAKEGAFTGEVSGARIRASGCSHVRAQPKSQHQRKRDLVLVFTQRQLPSPSLCKMRHSRQGYDPREPPTQRHDVLPQLAGASSPDEVSKQAGTHRDSENTKRASRLWRHSKHWDRSPRTDSRRRCGQRCSRREPRPRDYRRRASGHGRYQRPSVSVLARVGSCRPTASSLHPSLPIQACRTVQGCTKTFLYRVRHNGQGLCQFL